MKIMKKIDELISIAESSDKIKIGEIVISLTEYVTFVAEKEARAHINSMRDEDTEKDIEEKYKECVNEIKELNNISSELLGHKIYDHEFEREKIENFLQELLSEIFENRKVSRK